MSDASEYEDDYEDYGDDGFEVRDTRHKDFLGILSK
jgi:hypothetical protein